MVELIALGIFFVSAIGAAFILLRKMPILADLPKNGHHGFKKPELAARAEKKIKELHFHFFTKQILLQRILSKLRLWVLKIERSVDVRLHGIRKKAQELDKQVKRGK